MLVGGRGVLVGGTGVAVGGRAVLVGGTEVAVGGAVVEVEAGEVALGACVALAEAVALPVGEAPAVVVADGVREAGDPVAAGVAVRALVGVASTVGEAEAGGPSSSSPPDVITQVSRAATASTAPPPNAIRNVLRPERPLPPGGACSGVVSSPSAAPQESQNVASPGCSAPQLGQNIFNNSLGGGAGSPRYHRYRVSGLLRAGTPAGRGKLNGRSNVPRRRRRHRPAELGPNGRRLLAAGPTYSPAIAARMRSGGCHVL